MSFREAAISMQRVPIAAAGLAQLSFYSPRMRQPAHRHERAHVSIIVTGSIREVTRDRDEIGHALELNFRPCEITHQVEFGPQGALILAVDIADRVTHALATGWIRRELSAMQRKLLNCLLAEKDRCAEDVCEYVEDLLTGIETEAFRGLPPRWLMLAREQLLEAPANVRIDALARAAGVHRAHFARAFQHWFKTPPSLFRRRAMLSRAIAAIVAGQDLALAAQTAGFADQSHLCRSMRKMIGTTPYRLLRRA